MKLFRRMRLIDEYTIEKSRDANDKDYILFHETSSLRGFNNQRVFKGSLKECREEKKRLEKERLKDINR